MNPLRSGVRAGALSPGESILTREQSVPFQACHSGAAPAGTMAERISTLNQNRPFRIDWIDSNMRGAFLWIYGTSEADAG